ncbi:hypothetical protein Tco_0658503 [Tanacetum coccineum]
MLSGGGTNTHTSSLLNWRSSSRIESIHAGSVMRVLLSLVPEGDPKSTDIHEACGDESVGVGAVSAVVVDAVGV